MTSFQKVIKYGAIAFGVYLSLTIIGITIFVITTIFGITAGIGLFSENNKEDIVITKWEQEYSNITNLDIELKICELDIKKGDKLKVEASDISDKFECQTDGNKLRIKDKKVIRGFWDIEEEHPKITVYIPETITFEQIKIETGMNDTNIEYLKADTIKLEMGVGRYRIENIVAQNVKIAAGAGEAIIADGSIGDLKLDGGIGKLTITSQILENAKISCGVGKMELNLRGNQQDYKIDAESGIGNFVVNNQKISGKQTIGNGMTNIKIDSGVGETIVKFVNSYNS